MREEEEGQDSVGVSRECTFTIPSRTSYLICRAQYKMKMQNPLYKDY